MQPNLPYRTDIDGLRALAVLAVVGYHAFPNVIPGGFIGVDLFFVISGYLISTILFVELDSPKPNFTIFYIKRIKRIFPALILILISCIIFGYFALLPSEYIELGKHVSGGAGFYSNFILWNETGYFDTSAESKPLLHLWSLGVEEQFYLVWPLLLWIAWRKNVSFLLLILFTLFTSFVSALLVLTSSPEASFYFPWNRIWELMLGGLVASLMFHKANFFDFSFPLKTYSKNLFFIKLLSPESIKFCLGLLGICALSLGMYFINKRSLFPGWWAILPTMGAVLLIIAGPTGWINRNILSLKFLVWIGLISYPLYLWHWPILSFLNIIEFGKPSTNFIIYALLLSFVLAWLTFYFFERPIRKSKISKVSTGILCLSLFIVFLIGIGIFINGKRETYSLLKTQQSAIKLNLLPQTFNILDPRQSEENCLKKFPTNSSYCFIQDINKDPTVAIIGDSHAGVLWWGLSEFYFDKKENVLAFGYGGCPPLIDPNYFFGGCVASMGKVINYVLTHQNIKQVVLSSMGPHYFRNSEAVQIIKSELILTISTLLKANKKVIYVIDNPELGFNPRSCFRPLTFSQWDNPLCLIKKSQYETRVKSYLDIINTVRNEFPDIQILDPSKFLCDSTYCYSQIKGVSIYEDENHLNVLGSLYIGEQLAKERDNR